MLIQEHPNFVTKDDLAAIWAICVCNGPWRFGQKSNPDTLYPMWHQGYYDNKTEEYPEGIPDNVIELGKRFLELCGEDYILVRNMMAGNTFGQDGDIHKDWLHPGESLTGVIYLNRRWEDNWGGETLVYSENGSAEISKFEAGKLAMFDGYYDHIGKGPQRACGELRCILAIQAVKRDAWEKHLDNMRKIS